MTPLCELAEKYTTDKCSVHRYTPVYYELFKDRIATVQTVLEIGIGRGKGTLRKHAASLKMWEEFFPFAQIIGLDHDRSIFLDQGRINSVYGDQSNERSMEQAANSVGRALDIVIDDGSHQPPHQISSAKVLLPFVMPGGYYIIEEIRSEVVFEQLSKFRCASFDADRLNMAVGHQVQHRRCAEARGERAA
jgi:hypothetical protein